MRMSDPYQMRTADYTQRDLLDPELIKAWKSTAERWGKNNPENRDLVIACERIVVLADEALDLNRRVAEGRELRAEQDKVIEELRNSIPVEGEESPTEEVNGTTSPPVSGTTNPDADTE